MTVPTSALKLSRSPVSIDEVDIGALYSGQQDWTLRGASGTLGARRREFLRASGDRLLFDNFASTDAACCFFRLAGAPARSVRLTLRGAYSLQSCRSGGWLLEPEEDKEFFYWIPQAPMLRGVSRQGHLSDDRFATFAALNISASSSIAALSIPDGSVADLAIWRIPAQEKSIIEGLRRPASLETQKIFLWGSHTTYERPADLYLHLVFGWIYECRQAWPFKRRICSENDAHSLYVALNGLERATGRKLYGLFKQQIVLSVLARQADDGGWHHGEWTEDMDAHLRLNASAGHLLLDALEERQDPALRRALERVAGFISRHTDKTATGDWFLHDSLELSLAAMQKSPFQWTQSRAFGKSPSNMLVLNTHLDSLVFMDRFSQVTGDRQYAESIDSARSAARAILDARPLEWLYRAMFRIIQWTLLPTAAQRKLPVPLRALKRVAGRWIIPNFYRLTARVPRLVMPGGYIERAIAIGGLADPYHAVNVMDLARYRRRFPQENVGLVLRDAVEFVHTTGLQEHWGERAEKAYAVGFWVEALYHLYLLEPERKLLAELAEAILKAEELGLGLPPSLLGGNAEAVPAQSQNGCPTPADSRLRIANLSRNGELEFLVLNPTADGRTLEWENLPVYALVWQTSTGESLEGKDTLHVPPRDWICGRAAPVH